jgi:hypothetical protein
MYSFSTLNEPPTEKRKTSNSTNPTFKDNFTLVSFNKSMGLKQ